MEIEVQMKLVTPRGMLMINVGTGGEAAYGLRGRPDSGCAGLSRCSDRFVDKALRDTACRLREEANELDMSAVRFQRGVDIIRGKEPGDRE